MKSNFRYLLLFFFLVAADQYLKFIFSKISICNKNIAWSISIAPGFFYFLWLIIFLLLLYLFLKSKSGFKQISLILVLAGAISNMIDRISRSCVVDFINIRIWPVFNLADIYITIGVTTILIILLKSKYQNQNIKSSSKSKIKI